MIQELLKAFFLIFIAEMGDKTQILAMAFATRYPVGKVLTGLFFGVFINHGIAVILGSYISMFVPIDTIQILAGIAFVGFALWTLKPSDDRDEDNRDKNKYGPVVTVALAFFIGELGDKTQLTTITLSADAVYPLFILMGTVSGMIVTGGIGIFVGRKIGDRVPENAIKLIAASVFMFFGISKLYNTVPDIYLTWQYVLAFMLIISAAVFMVIRPVIIRKDQEKESPLKRQSRELYDYYRQVERKMDKICLGIDNCRECRGNNCMVGYTKGLIKSGLNGEIVLSEEPPAKQQYDYEKHYNKEQVLEGLKLTVELINKNPDKKYYDNIHNIKKSLESILSEGNN